MNLSERIREAVRKDGRNEAQIATEAGIARSTLHRFMRGRGAYSDVLDALAEVLGLELVEKRRSKRQR